MTEEEEITRVLALDDEAFLDWLEQQMDVALPKVIRQRVYDFEKHRGTIADDTPAMLVAPPSLMAKWARQNMLEHVVEKLQ